MPQEIRAGSIVLMRGFKRTTVGDIVEATFSYPADGKGKKARYDIFLYLGNCDRETLKNNLDANKMLEEMGWKFVGDEGEICSPRA